MIFQDSSLRQGIGSDKIDGRLSTLRSNGKQLFYTDCLRDKFLEPHSFPKKPTEFLTFLNIYIYIYFVEVC